MGGRGCGESAKSTGLSKNRARPSAKGKKIRRKNSERGGPNKKKKGRRSTRGKKQKSGHSSSKFLNSTRPQKKGQGGGSKSFSKKRPITRAHNEKKKKPKRGKRANMLELKLNKSVFGGQWTKKRGKALSGRKAHWNEQK